jgi:hypothetical protein
MSMQIVWSNAVTDNNVNLLLHRSGIARMGEQLSLSPEGRLVPTLGVSSGPKNTRRRIHCFFTTTCEV